jgi:putative hemolysin
MSARGGAAINMNVWWRLPSLRRSNTAATESTRCAREGYEPRATVESFFLRRATAGYFLLDAPRRSVLASSHCLRDGDKLSPSVDNQVILLKLQVFLPNHQ